MADKPDAPPAPPAEEPRPPHGDAMEPPPPLPIYAGGYALIFLGVVLFALLLVGISKLLR